MEALKKADFWCVGMDGYAKKEMGEDKLPQKCVIVMGSEGEGMRRLTSENCDYAVKLPIARTVESLNVSNACAIALYEWSRIHLK
jgi:23S rRNA (guanosine2251-2'-O)-methyltransferase